MIKLRTIGLLALTAGVFTLSSCGGEKSDNNQNEKNEISGSVRIDGSSTVYPITEAVAEEFRVHAPNVDVTIGVSGTGGGFKKFARGETDISNASRSIKDIEIKSCEENNISYLELEVAYDGLAVVVNPENDWAKSMTVAELKMIWSPESQGKLTKWNQIRPEWPDENINLFGPGVASGTFDYFTEVIVGESGASRGDFNQSEDDNTLVQGVSTDKFALGFFGIAYFEENKEKLKLLGVDNGQGPIIPTTETVKNGTYAPLSRPLFIYVNSRVKEKPELIEFVNFYLDEAGFLAKDVGYIALQESEYDEQKAKFKAFLTSI